MSAKALLAFIRERHRVYLRREAGLTPLTKDPILQTYRFCNVYRELDTVTQWIAKNIREPFEDHPNLWFMLAIARRINWPDTLEELMKVGAWPKLKTYDPEKLRLALDARTARGEKVYTSAYMVTAENRPGETKSYTTAYSNLGRLWEKRKMVAWAINEGDTLEEIYDGILGGGFAWGSFMTAQVIADLKYARPFRDKEDWGTFAASGPGSRRGLNRVLGRALDAPWKEETWRQELLFLRRAINQAIEKEMPTLHAQDLQNCLCEFDKYERVRLGEGKPKQLFRGGSK